MKLTDEQQKAMRESWVKHCMDINAKSLKSKVINIPTEYGCYEIGFHAAIEFMQQLNKTQPPASLDKERTE